MQVCAAPMTATGTGFVEMYLAAGLPLTSFGRDKKAFQDYLCRGGKPVSFRYEGQDYAVTISNILRNYANSNRNKEQRVYQELKEYNFWRNLYGTKGIALVVYLLIIVREITLHGTIDIKIFFKSISRLCSSNINDSIRCDLCTIRQQANGYNKGV